MSKKCYLFFFLFISGTLQAQTKFEREYRATEEMIPEKAVVFIDSCFSGEKIKWYAEESQDGKSFEAKTCYQKFKYSIEFDTLGTVWDVEKTVKFKALEPALQTNLSKGLDGNFSSWKIVKIQIQWKASHPVLIELIKSGISDDEFFQAYEIVLKGKKDGSAKYFEVLMNEDGEILKELEIIQRNTDNLEF